MKTKTLRKIHTWVGLCAAVFFLSCAVTGILLTFRGTFSAPRVEVPVAIQQEPAVDVWKIVERAETLTGAKASSVSFSDKPTSPIRVRVKDEHRSTLYYSLSGVLIEKRDRSERSFNGWMWDIHTGAIAGRPGEIFMASIGFFLVVAIISGFLIWPFLVRRQKERKKLRFGKQPSNRWVRGLQN